MKYKELYEYIPYLENIEGTNEGIMYINPDIEVSLFHMPHYQYSEEINALLSLINKLEVINDNYDEVLSQFYGNVDYKTITDEKLLCNDIEVIKSHITKIVRQDRFVHGALAECLKNGIILKLIKKLKELDK